MSKMTVNGDYLIIARKKEIGNGTHKMIVERGFLVENIECFKQNNPDVKQEDITIYELRELNEEPKTLCASTKHIKPLKNRPVCCKGGLHSHEL